MVNRRLEEVISRGEETQLKRESHCEVLGQAGLPEMQQRLGKKKDERKLEETVR